MRELNWGDSGIKLTKEDIDHAQKKLGIELPEDYIYMLSKHAGANNPDECEFKYFDNNDIWIGNFGILLSIRENDHDTENIFTTLEYLSVDNQLPKKVVPIIQTGSGDTVCLDYRASLEQPSISYFCHEKNIEDCMIPLANTFSEFLDMLEVPEDEFEED